MYCFERNDTTSAFGRQPATTRGTDLPRVLMPRRPRRPSDGCVIRRKRLATQVRLPGSVSRVQDSLPGGAFGALDRPHLPTIRLACRLRSGYSAHAPFLQCCHGVVVVDGRHDHQLQALYPSQLGGVLLAFEGGSGGREGELLPNDLPLAIACCSAEHELLRPCLDKLLEDEQNASNCDRCRPFENDGLRPRSTRPPARGCRVCESALNRPFGILRRQFHSNIVAEGQPPTVFDGRRCGGTNAFDQSSLDSRFEQMISPSHAHVAPGRRLAERVRRGRPGSSGESP